MIKEEVITINGHPRNIKHFISFGYEISVSLPCLVRTEHLMPGSTTKVTTICDYCSRETVNTFKDYFNYTNGLNEPFFCKKCNSIKNKITSTINWGVDNPMKSELVKERLRKSITDKYGVSHYSNTDSYKSSYKNTCKKKYGFENTFQVQEFKDKSKESVRAKWEVDYFLQTKESKEKNKEKKENATKEKFSYIIGEDYKVSNYTDNIFKVYHKGCGKEIFISKQLLEKRIDSRCVLCTICNPVNIQESYIEIEIKEYIKELNVEFISRDRILLDGKELDILIPDYKIAIEINGIYWHNELFKSKEYHLEKSQKCIDKGVFLMHIWEDDWRNRKMIVKSIIRNRLGKINNRIWARKCIIMPVTTAQEKDFLNKNHIQGWASSQFKFGLFHNSELVSLMTFGERQTNGKKKMELIRFCNKIDTNVLGSASKIFTYFLGLNKSDIIISYSDFSLFDGSMYKKLGFIKKSLSEPNYFWVVEKRRRHRYNYSKKKLVSQGFDSSLTEVKIMHKRGYFRVWGCGQICWEYVLAP